MQFFVNKFAINKKNNICIIILKQLIKLIVKDKNVSNKNVLIDQKTNNEFFEKQIKKDFYKLIKSNKILIDVIITNK